MFEYQGSFWKRGKRLFGNSPLHTSLIHFRDKSTRREGMQAALAYQGFFAPWIHQPILRLRHHPCETLSFHDEVERLQGSRWSLGILGLFQALCDTPRQKPREQLWIVVGHSPIYRGGAISKMLWVVLRRLSLEFFLSLSLSRKEDIRRNLRVKLNRPWNCVCDSLFLAIWLCFLSLQFLAS